MREGQAEVGGELEEVVAAREEELKAVWEGRIEELVGLIKL